MSTTNIHNEIVPVNILYSPDKMDRCIDQDLNELDSYFVL